MPAIRRCALAICLVLAAALPAAAAVGPQAPVGLRITQLAPDRIALDWLKPAEAPAGYRVYRNGAPIRDLDGGATTFNDTGLQPSTLYIYRLAALGEGSPAPESPLSKQAANWTLPPAGTNAPRGDDYDVLVVAATPGGIAAAVSAARLGAKVALVEPSRWIGGMMAGGLSNTDFRYRETHGGIFKEFINQVVQYYSTVYGPHSRQLEVTNGGYKFEPFVARAIFTRMLAAEGNLSLYTEMRAVGVRRQGNRITGVTFQDPAGAEHTLTARFVVDASYEGDIGAMMGVPFTTGRESKSDYNEQYAGEMFWNIDTKKVVWGSGKGDNAIQAYNYRLCMTTDPNNRLPAEKPEGYDRTPYLKIIADAKRLREDGKTPYITVTRVLGLQGSLPNDKWDINNSGAYWPSTDFIGGNTDYPTAGWKRRDEIARAHRTYEQGLLYFLQNDPELPEAFRKEANRWGLARDEFVDNGNWPTALYIREGRRFRNAYWFTENDSHPRPGEQRSPLQPTGVATGDYSLDSHATHPPKPDTPNLVEGFFYGGPTRPYQIPFGVMVPTKVEGLLMPVAVSATHIGLSTIRMEPTWMALGQAAGTAAYISVRQGVPVSRIPVPLVQDVTLLSHQVTIFLKDVEYDDPNFRGLMYGGLIGLFPTEESKPNDALDRGTAAEWVWRWMQVRSPGLQAPKAGPQFADVAADSPAAPATRALACIGAVPPPKSGEAFNVSEPLAGADAVRWIVSAYHASDRWNAKEPPAYRTYLDRQITGMLNGVIAADSAIDAKSLTRGQFLRLLYLAAETGAPRE